MLTIRERSSEAAFTLVELLVVMTIFAVIGGIVTTTVVRSIQVSHRAQQRAESLATLQNTLQRVGREVRAADPLLLATGTDVRRDISIRVLRGGEEHLVRYYIDADGDFVEDREIRDLSVDPPALIGEVEGRLLASNVAVDAVNFTYFDDAFDEDFDEDDPLAVGDPIDCADPTTGIIPADDDACLARYLGAAYVELRVTTDLVRTEDQQILTLINLRNEN